MNIKSIRLQTSIKKLVDLYDGYQMLDSIRALPFQINSVFLDEQFTKFPVKKKNINRIIVAGMGSSLIAFKLIESIFREKFTEPVFTNNTFILPAWANKDTVVIISSYSGNSKEMISCAKEAITKKCTIIGISTGGELESILNNKCLFFYKINPQNYNPSKQPRMAVGFSFASYLQIFSKMGIISSKEINLTSLISNAEIKALNREALMYASLILNKYVHIISAGYLSGNAELFAKQLNWNSKQIASFSLSPEAMHHISEGIFHPGITLKNNYIFIFLLSPLLKEEDRTNLEILISYFKRNKISPLKISVIGRTIINVVIQMMFLSSLISFYSAMMYKEDPTPTPGIAYYKNYFLKKHKHSAL